MGVALRNLRIGAAAAFGAVFALLATTAPTRVAAQTTPAVTPRPAAVGDAYRPDAPAAGAWTGTLSRESDASEPKARKPPPRRARQSVQSAPPTAAAVAASPPDAPAVAPPHVQPPLATARRSPVSGSPAAEAGARRGSQAADPPSTGLREGAPAATRASIAATPENTTFSLALSAPLKAEVYTMARPSRVVIDLPDDVAFALPTATGRQGRGLITAFRYGLVAERQSRIILDLARPARVVAARMLAEGNGGGAFTLELTTVDEATFLKSAYEPPALRRQTLADDATPPAPPPRALPSIVIDAGHGGIDPGALGHTDIAEKHVALAVARVLRTLLQATGRYDVHMTRDTDVFVSLADRVRVSQARHADLFISIHADSIAEVVAARVRGASIYTLSDKASDAIARRLADKENAADTVAGLPAIPSDDQDVVRNILIDLMKTETARFSSEFGTLLTDRLGRSIALARQPLRAAAFKVLKQAQSPSVLIELGYMSHTDDEKLLASPVWQRRVGQSIAAAVDAYFAKRRTAAR